ncbi:MAG TPA: hypothetical protein VIB79_07250 [Candidatus Binatia bacterium]|jgi:hypothetical protein
MTIDTVEILRRILEADLRLIDESTADCGDYREWARRRAELFGSLDDSHQDSSTNRNLKAELVQKIVELEGCILRDLEQNLAALAAKIDKVASWSHAAPKPDPHRAIFVARTI